METIPEAIARLDRELHEVRTGASSGVGGRRSLAAPLSLGLTGTDWQADTIALGVLVGPGGRLAVTATARLTPGAGATAAMGWRLVGPYLDEERTAPLDPTGALVTIEPDAGRALTAVAVDLAASYTYEHLGLAAGWWTVSARYRATGGTGTATGRQLLAVP